MLCSRSHARHASSHWRPAVTINQSLRVQSGGGGAAISSGVSQSEDQSRLTGPAPSGMTCGYVCGRYWDRTSDLLGVNEALSR
jgi:hypothetical protein